MERACESSMPHLDINSLYWVWFFVFFLEAHAQSFKENREKCAQRVLSVIPGHLSRLNCSELTPETQISIGLNKKKVY